VPAKKKETMSIYLMFIQHIMHLLKENGKAAIVVPTGFITAQGGIDKKIRKKLIDEKMLSGVVSMPSNIFANTGTNVSILFIDKANKGDIVLIDASNLGEKIKNGKNQKTVLTVDEENKIIDVFNKKETVADFSVVVSYDDIEAKNYLFNAGQYFEVKIENKNITPDEFKSKIQNIESNLVELFKRSNSLSVDIKESFSRLDFNEIS
jgi:type I restriction enzyme M protein